MTKSELPHEINTWTLSTFYKVNALFATEGQIAQRLYS